MIGLLDSFLGRDSVIGKIVKITGEGLFVVLLILLALRVSAPYVLEWAINSQLEKAEGIYGQVADVDLHLYRGGYEIEGIQLFMEKGDKEYPLLEIKQLDLSILWRALINGHIVAEATMVEPILNLVDRADKKIVTNEAVKDEETWVELINSLTPFSLDRIEVMNGEFHFRKPDGEPKVDLFLTQVNMLVQNITNSEELSDTLLADIKVKAQAMGESNIQFGGKFNPFNTIPTFDLNLEMQRLPLKRLDDFIKAYSPIDIEAGSLDLALELAAKQGNIRGYIKPGIYDIDVFDWREDVIEDNDNPFQLLFEGLAGGLSALLKNDKRDLLATKVELEGDIESPDAPIGPILLGILKNGFINAYEMDVEDSVSFDQVDG